MSAEKRSISAPAELFAKADVRAADLDYNKFSDYIQHLIKEDVRKGGSHIREPATPYKVNSSPGQSAAGEILGAAGAHAQSAATPLRPPGKPAKYKIPRSSKKQPGA